MRLILLFMLIYASCLSFATDVTVVTNFNANQYLGKWYEIARLPNRFENQCITPIIATYSINPKDSKQIVVVNQCDSKSGNPDIASGVASFTGLDTVAKLRVTFLPKWLRWLPFGYGDYWVLKTDYKLISIVGSPNHEYLWILARTESITPYQLSQAIQFAKNQGFSTKNLIVNNK